MNIIKNIDLESKPRSIKEMNVTLKKFIQKNLTYQPTFKFSSDINGLLGARLSENAEKDGVRFENQGKNYTFKELNVSIF